MSEDLHHDQNRIIYRHHFKDGPLDGHIESTLRPCFRTRTKTGHVYESQGYQSIEPDEDSGDVVSLEDIVWVDDWVREIDLFYAGIDVV